MDILPNPAWKKVSSQSMIETQRSGWRWLTLAGVGWRWLVLDLVFSLGVIVHWHCVMMSAWSQCRVQMTHGRCS